MCCTPTRLSSTRCRRYGWAGDSDIPVIYEVRAFWEDAAVDLGTSREGGLRYRLSRALETFAFRHASHVTTICAGLKQDIVARGIPERRVTIIPNAVDVDTFEFGQKPDEALKARLGFAGKTVIGFIGSFYAYEGLDLLLAALPQVTAQTPRGARAARRRRPAGKRVEVPCGQARYRGQASCSPAACRMAKSSATTASSTCSPTPESPCGSPNS